MDTWGLRGTLVAAAVAVVIAGAGGAAIHAATASGFAPSGGHGGPGFGPLPQAPQSHASGAVRTETVVADGAGGFTVRLTQTGEVTAVDAGSVTARSDDGFIQRYVIPAGVTPPALTTGDDVAIRATRAGANAELTSITLEN